MNEIMLSIRPKWCELIASGQKTIEIRKTKPRCNVPFKVYIYCTEDFRTSTKDRNHKFWIGEPINGASDGRYLGNGKVIGEFVCDRIVNVDCDSVAPFDKDSGSYIDKQICIDREQFIEYTRFRCCFGWHISDLIIYDKPKDLSDFGMKRPSQSWCYVEKERESNDKQRSKYELFTRKLEGSNNASDYVCKARM